MGAQDEYLRNFCVLLTDKGVVPVTDPLQISVYEMLKDGMLRPMDISAKLDMSSSSLHFIIDKMTESGIVTKTKPENDKKTVYYSTNAVLLASSSVPESSMIDISAKTFSDPLKNYNGLSSVSNMLDCYISEIGINIDPLKIKYANALADSMDIGKMSIEDAVLEIRSIFARLTGFSFSVFSFNPLTLIITGDESIRAKTTSMLQFIIRLLENSTGRPYAVGGIEDFNGSDSMLKVTLTVAAKKEEPYINLSIRHKDEPSFLVIDIDGNAGIMTSDVQMDIIDAVYERPLCITDIVNKVDFPRSTITSNILRMVEEGVMSVFYSESGSAYYGLACSILLRKVRPMAEDENALLRSLENIREGAFMEGQFLYIMEYLRTLGFDTGYAMVVLGAKYMRAAGSSAEKGNFDTYFGKMSDIAKTIGLSLNVVSVYPLTIGITSSDPASEISPAMTFIEGMAHQGLEMAGNGLFVRNTEDTSVSFKEIYPALSMTPVKGVKVEKLAEPSTKKRTSSVKTALFNRSKKDSGKPARTVRYITGLVLGLFLIGILTFGISDNTGSDANNFNLTIDDELGIRVYDAEGTELQMPYCVSAGTVLTLIPGSEKNIGFVDNGIAYPLSTNDAGRYTLIISSDMHIERLYDISSLRDKDCSFSLYSVSGEPGKNDAAGYVDSEIYMKESKGLFVSLNSKIRIQADNGFYVASDDPKTDAVPLKVFVCSGPECDDIKIESLPTGLRTIDLGGDSYYYGDQLVSGELDIGADVTSIELRFAEDKNVSIKVNGNPVEVDSDNCFRVIIPLIGDVVLSSEETDLY